MIGRTALHRPHVRDVHRPVHGMHWSTPATSEFTYYVSYSEGDDDNPGTSSSAPFQTFDAVPTLNAGESVGFKRGDTWPALALPMVLNASGTADERIVLGAYGDAEDAKPIFDCEGTADRAIDGFDRNYITLEDLHCKNQEDASGRHAMRFGSSSTATRHNIRLIRVETTDSINGGDDGVYFQRNCDVYAEDCIFRGSENHLAFHPGATYTATLEAHGCEFRQSGNSSFGTGAAGGLTAVMYDCEWYDCLRAYTGTFTGDSVVFWRSRFTSLYTLTTSPTNTRVCGVDGINVTLRYCLIDWLAVGSNAQFSNPGVNTTTSPNTGHVHVFHNCTFLGNNAGSARGQIYANHALATVTAINCAFVRWNRVGFTTSTHETADYCYFDGGTQQLDTNSNPVTTAGYCDLATGRPGVNLTGLNKGTDLGLGALVDFAGAAVTVAAPTRGCYENAA